MKKRKDAKGLLRLALLDQGGKAMQTSRLMASEDFSEFHKGVPGVYIMPGRGAGR